MICDAVSPAAVSSSAPLDIGKSANPKYVAFFFWLYSNLLDLRSCSSVQLGPGSVNIRTAQGIFRTPHCTTSRHHSAGILLHDKSWLINRDGSSKRSRWRIESRCRLYRMCTCHHFFNDSINRSYAANVCKCIQKSWKPMPGASNSLYTAKQIYAHIFPNPVSESLYRVWSTQMNGWLR